MNREALGKTVQTGEAHYWSRSRKKLWRKGEESGHVQKVKAIRLDCDEDVILLEVEQTGGIACHTGRHSCFFQRLDGGKWVVTDPGAEGSRGHLQEPQAMIDANILRRLGETHRRAQAGRSVGFLRREPVREGRGRDPEEGRGGGGRDGARRQGR